MATAVLLTVALALAGALLANVLSLSTGTYVGRSVHWFRELTPFKGDWAAYSRALGRSNAHVFTHFTIFGHAVVVWGEEANKAMMSTARSSFVWGPGFPYNFTRLLPGSLFLQDGDVHERVRRLLAVAFHGDPLRMYQRPFQRSIWETLERFGSQERVSLKAEFRRLTLDIACHLLLGADVGQDTVAMSQEFEIVSQGLVAVPIAVPGTTFYRALQARERLKERVRAVLRRRQALLAAGEEPEQRDPLWLLLEARQQLDDRGDGTDAGFLSDEELLDQALMLAHAGHETTASIMTSLFVELARHPDVLARVREEQCRIFGPDCAPDAAVTMEHLSEMHYLEQVLLEVERLYPPFIGGFRMAQTNVDIGGYRITRGTKCQHNIVLTNLDETVFPDPNAFLPERWSRGHRQHRPFAMTTYGGGPRNCIGRAFARNEVKTLASLASRFWDWKLEDNAPVVNRLPTMSFGGHVWTHFTRQRTAAL